MAIILPRQQTWQESLGAGLGSGLGAGLSALADMKMKELQQRRAYEQALPAYKAMGMNPEMFWAPPALQVQMLKEAADQKAASEWARQYGLGEEGKSPEEIIPTRGEGPEQVAPKPSRKTISGMTANELASAMSTAPERIRRKLEPTLDIKKAEEKGIETQAQSYEKGLLERVNNAGSLNSALDELEEFARENPDSFGPVVGIQGVTSLAQRRDQLIKNVVDQMLSMKGALGRGTNLIVNIKEKSKPRSTMNIKELRAAINTVRKLPQAVFNESKDYEKMKSGKGLNKNFMSQLINRAVKRYESNAFGIQDLGKQEDLQNILGEPESLGQTRSHNGVEYEAVWEED